jgi:hypothetical protein
LLASAAEESEDPSATNEAGEWLRGELQDGPRLVVDVRRAAKCSGVAWRTLERAKAALGVEARRQSAGGGQRGAGAWVWGMPGDRRSPATKAARDDQDRRGELEGSPADSDIDGQDRQTRESGGLGRSAPGDDA